MQFSKLKVVISLMLLVVLIFLYQQQAVKTARAGGEPVSPASVALNVHPAPAEPDSQDNIATIAVSNAKRSDDVTEKQTSQNVENSTGADDGAISLDEILSRVAISQDENVFPQQYQVDIATTARLNDIMSHLDKDKLQLHVFSAECYEVLNECRVHYQANDSLVLYLMGSFEGMSQIGDQITESGDTVLKIAYRPDVDGIQGSAAN